jgi:hypothetical protein
MMAMTMSNARLVAVSRGTIDAAGRIMLASGPVCLRRFSMAIS